MFYLMLSLLEKKVGRFTREINALDGGRFLQRFISYKRILPKEDPNCLSFKSNISNSVFKNDNYLVYSNTRNYAKSRDIKREKNKVIKFDENELREYLDVEKLLTDFQKPLEYFKDELVKNATLRTSPNAIENLKVNFEGQTYTIQDLAEVGKKNPGLCVLDFSSIPAVIPSVMKTFLKSELNLNAQQDGTKVFVPIPKVTKEQREAMAKKCKLYFYKCKDAIRGVQIMYEKSVNKIEKLPIDEKFRITEQLTALGNKQILLAEEILKEKQGELLQDVM